MPPPSKLDIDLDIVKSVPDGEPSAVTNLELATEKAYQGEDEEGNDQPTDGKLMEARDRPDRRFQAADAACAGLLFLRFRVDVPPVDFVQKMFGMGLASTDAWMHAVSYV